MMKMKKKNLTTVLFMELIKERTVQGVRSFNNKTILKKGG